MHVNEFHIQTNWGVLEMYTDRQEFNWFIIPEHRIRKQSAQSFYEIVSYVIWLGHTSK